MKPRPIPREYQLKVIEDIKAAYKKGYKRVLLVMPTGSGKTFTFSHMAKMAFDRGRNIIATGHKKTIFNQISNSFKKFGIPHGLIKGNIKNDLSQSAQVCSVQTIALRLAKGTLGLDADLVIMDEAHHAAADQWAFLFDYFKDAYFLGVTATPCRLDGRGLGDFFEYMVLGPSVLDLVELGLFKIPVVYQPETLLDLTNISTSMGDFNSKELERAVNRSTITGNVIAEYKAKAEGRPAVAFCISVEHCEQVAWEFEQAGYSATWVASSLSEEEIDRRLKALEAGEVDLVCSCNLISEGTDISAIGCVIQLRPTHSLSLYLQMVGRARSREGKPAPIILDHVGNFQRHGHPAQDREWSLDMTKKKIRKGQTEEADIKVSECKNCYAVFLPADVCPECGTPVEKKARVLTKVEGELKEVTLEEAQKLEAAKQKRMAVGRAVSLEGLYEIAKEREYQQRWILIQYKIKIMRQYKSCKGDKNKLVKFQNTHEFMQWDTASEATLDRAIKKKYNTFMSLNPKLK